MFTNVIFQIVKYDEITSTWIWDENKIQKFCGREMPRDIEINNANRLRIIFHSNNNINGDGFSVCNLLFLKLSTLQNLHNKSENKGN